MEEKWQKAKINDDIKSGGRVGKNKSVARRVRYDAGAGCV